MHALKGTWVGQTFALSKINESSESGGKKTRMRRSKEERKAMIETFIKKYQDKNNGNFPSLNLTHKEVGGSFYTVREIVREVIQENRVLGPAKLTPQEKTSGAQFSEEYPLGLIATEPQIFLSVPPREIQPHLVSSLDDGHSDERVGFSGDNHNADEELKIVNGNIVDLKNGEAVDVIDQSIRSSHDVIDLSNVEVEAFPLKSTAEVDMTVSSKTVDENQKAALDSSSANENSRLYELSSQEKSAPEDDRVDEGHAISVVAIAESLVNGDSKVGREFSEAVVQSSDSFKRNEGIVHDNESGKNFIDEEPSGDDSSAEGSQEMKEDSLAQAIDVPNGVHAKSLNGALRNVDTEKSSQEAEIGSQPDGPSNGSIPKERNPTLDRINLSKAWEVSSRNSSRRDTNPIVAILKTFIVSFVKFWTEE